MYEPIPEPDDEKFSFNLVTAVLTIIVLSLLLGILLFFVWNAGLLSAFQQVAPSSTP